MSDDERVEGTENREPAKARRAFVKTAAQVAVTAPAVSILLAAGLKPAEALAGIIYTAPGPKDGGPEGTGTFDGNLGDDV
jgi:hypothetical protein